MAKKLVVVESPSKVKTINKFLGKDYKVAASYGHIIDLPKSELGVDVDKKYKPKYVLSNKKAMTKLKESFKGIDTLIIASDPDREGEAIGWHVAQKLGVINAAGKKKGDIDIKRIVFTSITKDAVLEAIGNPRSIDLDLINAQQARRVLDRLVGYKLSPLLWKKIRFGLSAGRVQSVALRLVVDREDERDAFKPEEYWNVLLDLSEEKKTLSKYKVLDSEQDNPEFKNIKFELKKVDGKKFEVNSQKEAEKILDKIMDQKEWNITDVTKRKSNRNPKPPFITSTLQQSASNRFGYSSKKTMSVAQKLYEAGFITYMRTDSFNVVPAEVEEVRKFVEKAYGDNYLEQKARHFAKKSKNAQEAHEAIRPTDISKDSNSLKLVGEQAKLYDLIRTRILATQMKPAELENTTVKIDQAGLLIQATGQRLVFDGYLKVYFETVSENLMPELNQGDKLYSHEVYGIQNFTKPPARYTEATLIKALEANGIGRPSTYAPTISTIMGRKYVEKEEKYLVPTDTGKVVTRLLKKYFPDIVDLGFTAEMEDDLDKIADGELDWVKAMDTFYKPFIKTVEKNDKEIGREEFTVLEDAPKDVKCPECGKKMIVKLGRYGRFYSCANFPDCKGMRGMDGSTEEDREKELAKKVASKEFNNSYKKAPKTDDGRDYNLRTGRFGDFWAHPDYPKVKDYKPLELKKSKIIELYGKPPQTDDGKDFVFRSGRYGKYWAHPEYPKVKKTVRIKEDNPSKS